MIFAGHVGALRSERLRLICNAYTFTCDLQNYAALEELREELMPTAPKKLLALDLDPEPFGGRSIYRCAEVYLPSAPMTLEVIDNPDDSSPLSFKGEDDSSKLKVTGVLKPQSDSLGRYNDGHRE